MIRLILDLAKRITKSFKKKVYLIPLDIIKQMKRLGFYLKDVSYWHKSSGIPRKNNFGDHFEYFLIFSKSKRYQLNDFNF